MDIEAARELANKRSLLLSARMRYSPQTQPIRDTAIQRMIEQNFLLASAGTSLTLDEIQSLGLTANPIGVPAFSVDEVKRAVTSLISAKRLEANNELFETRYSLSQKASEELWALQGQTEARFNRVLTKAFNKSLVHTRYSAPLLMCLSMVFSQLGEAYVRFLKRDLSVDQLLKMPEIGQCIAETLKEFPSIDHSVFESGVISIFRDSDPDYDTVKWNFAQNYYVAKALGMDPGGYLLSKEVFGGAVFFLDTNVIAHALNPKATYFSSFKALSVACQKMNIALRVCQITIDEFNLLVERKRGELEKVIDQVPPALQSRIDDDFYALYRDRQTQQSDVSIADVLACFNNPATKLKEYGVKLVHDPWFDQAKDTEETQGLAQGLSNLFEAKHRRPKGKRASLHDALVLQWIKLQRGGRPDGTWFISRDTTLPAQSSTDPSIVERPIPITLDALLQWLSPIAMNEDSEDQAAQIFSEAIKHQLLPQDSIFDMRDFLVFADLDWSTKELPADDVEKCIRYLRAEAPNLDPTDPLDREKLFHAIGKFFADPGRTYKKELCRLEEEVTQLKTQEIKRSLEGESTLREKDELIRQLEKREALAQETHRIERLQRSAMNRLWAAIAVWMGIAFTAAGCIHEFGEGVNFLQQLIKAWSICLPIFAVLPIIVFIFLGKERVKYLPWGVKKVLGESKD